MGNDPKKLQNLEKLLSGKSPYVLFPSDDAIPCDELPSNAAIIAIDGTWRQARSILHNSKYLQSLPQCQVTVRKNEYVIRTQPEEGFVSTLGFSRRCCLCRTK